ncbi:MAG: hypothetical protein NZ960_06950 [Candidatus Kapabacteria bacterium]|nr:hypothetical protein [Candidatus Kapabacteria bacterium]MDW8012908.1 hypothetical protein [Bacteroidota bacterium]
MNASPPPQKSLQWWHAANYAARALLIVAGLFLAFGGVPVPPESEPFIQVFGVVMALFGVYRLASYRWRVRQWERENDDRRV